MVAIIKNLLFPKFCFACHRFGSYLCPLCAKKLRLIKNDVCPYCQKQSYFGLTHPGCKRRLGLDGLKSFFYYDDLVKKIIINIKYRLVTEAIDDFLTAIPYQKIAGLFFYKQLGKDFIFTPVPLHPKRQRKRGFNQSEEMVRFFARVVNFPVNKKLIIRIKNTKPQAELKKPRERYKNILGAFSLAKNIKTQPVKGKKFVVFDDVWTTGWTIKEIARVLKKAGASKVFALTIAR